MKNNSILNSLVLAKANAKRSGMALLLGFATFSLAVGGMSLTARAQRSDTRTHPRRLDQHHHADQQWRIYLHRRGIVCRGWRLASDGRT